jgi:hypothetical protein
MHHKEVVLVLEDSPSQNRPGARTRSPLRRRRRAVLVRVIAHGHVVDSFEASRPQTLRAALHPIYANLPAEDGTVRFHAVEEEWLPLGFGRVRRESDLADLDDAVTFLAA